MFDFLKNWLSRKDSVTDRPPADILRRTGAYRPPAPRKRPAAVATRPAPTTPAPVVTRPAAKSAPGDKKPKSRIENLGPGKNVLVESASASQNGPFDNDELWLVDDSRPASADESGIDPYNTGKFDRSKNWDKRSRNR